MMDPDRKDYTKLDGFSLTLPLPYRVAIVLVAGVCYTEKTIQFSN